MKKFHNSRNSAAISALLVLLLFCGVCRVSAGAINITVQGSPVVFPDAQPFIDANSRTLVPVRFLGDALGCSVQWDGDFRRARFTKQSGTPGRAGQTIVDFFVDSNAYRVIKGRGEPVELEMDTAAVISQSRTYAPLRYLAEALGAAVTWDGATGTAVVSYPKEEKHGFAVPSANSFEYYFATHENPDDAVVVLTMSATIFSDDKDNVAAEIGAILKQQFSESAAESGVQKIKEYLNADRDAAYNTPINDSGRYFAVVKYDMTVSVLVYAKGINPADLVAGTEEEE